MEAASVTVTGYQLPVTSFQLPVPKRPKLIFPFDAMPDPVPALRTGFIRAGIPQLRKKNFKSAFTDEDSTRNKSSKIRFTLRGPRDKPGD
jgi:hypothetical protein